MDVVSVSDSSRAVREGFVCASKACGTKVLNFSESEITLHLPLKETLHDFIPNITTFGSVNGLGRTQSYRCQLQIANRYCSAWHNERNFQRLRARSKEDLDQIVSEYRSVN
jgi:aspartate carbamoyltransferase catalytic subunit